MSTNIISYVFHDVKKALGSVGLENRRPCLLVPNSAGSRVMGHWVILVRISHMVCVHATWSGMRNDDGKDLDVVDSNISGAPEALEI